MVRPEKGVEAMKSPVVIMVIVLGTAVAGLAQDTPGAEACRIDGAWMGHLPSLGVVWTGVFDSNNYWSGPTMMRFVGGDPSIKGLMPTARAFSFTIGSWHRVGDRSFECTNITYGLDDEGQPVYIAKINGRFTTSEDCDTVESSHVEIGLFSVIQDPFGNNPPYFGTIEDTSSNLCQRIRTDRRLIDRDPGDEFDS